MMDWPVNMLQWLFLVTVPLYFQAEGKDFNRNSSFMNEEQSMSKGRIRRAVATKGPSCHFPFVAGGLNYTTCTMTGQTRAYWCATTDSYDRDGQWMWCDGPATVGAVACYIPFLYKGVLTYDCVTNIDPAYKWCASTYNYDRDRKAIYCLEVDFQSTSLVSSTIGLSGGLMSTTSMVSLQALSTSSASETITSAFMTTSQMGSTSHVIYDGFTQAASPNLTSEDTATSSTEAQDLVSTQVPTPTTTSSSTSGAESAIISSSEMLGNTTNYLTESTSTTSATTLTANSSLTSVEYPVGTSTKYFPNTTNIHLLEEWLEISFWNSSTGAGLEIIPDLQKYASAMSSFGFNKDEVPLIANILGNITQNVVQSNRTFNVATIADILYITNQLLKESSWAPATSANNALGPQMLQCFENVLASMETSNQSMNISFENIDFRCLAVPCSSLLNGATLEHESHINVSLRHEGNGSDFSPSCLANLLSLSYSSLSNDFPNNFENHIDPGVVYKVSGQMVTNTMFIDNRNHHLENIKMSFLCDTQDCHSRAICVFWNFTIGKWSSEGCTTVIVDGVINCFCRHLTSFSVLISNILPQDLINISILDYITSIGLVISIASLIACISLQMYLLKGTVNLVAYYRHVAILNVSSFLLLSNISFMGASYIKPPQFLRLCVALTFCTHFSLLAFFCWTLVQSMVLFCRLVFVFHHITKKEFMTVSAVLGYVSPMLIAVGTFLYYTPTDNYRRDKVCWLQSESGASMAFAIPTIVIISLNFLVLIVVVKKLLRPSISEGGREDEEVVKKLMKAVVFCTPQFGLTWVIGIPLLTNGDSLFLQYFFVLLNPLQGFFIFVFGCLLDKKVMDILKRRLSKKPAFSSTATTVSTY